MPRRPSKPLNFTEERLFNLDEIEDSPKISQDQLSKAKIFSSREEYAKSLSKGIRYMEIGVAWGYSAKLFIEASVASEALLIDLYNQDLKCWSWRKFGSCQCEGFKHELLYTPETHEQYIVDQFEYHPKVKTLKGDAEILLKNITQEYDFIYIDVSNDRFVTRNILSSASRLVPIGGIVGLNDYLIYDGIIEDQPYGTFQTVNEFLEKNNNWSVDAIALHNLGFYDIYIRKDK
jgi:hypothetical protein